jgi:hypothetical protein
MGKGNVVILKRESPGIPTLQLTSTQHKSAKLGDAHLMNSVEAVMWEALAAINLQYHDLGMVYGIGFTT